MKHNDLILQGHLIDYLEKNLKDCIEKRVVINRIKDGFLDHDYPYEEWVDLPEDWHFRCDRCGRKVQRYYHKHFQSFRKREQLPIHYIDPFTDICLCENCQHEIKEGAYE